jgi:hypothetical protein
MKTPSFTAENAKSADAEGEPNKTRHPQRQEVEAYPLTGWNGRGNDPWSRNGL